MSAPPEKETWAGNAAMLWSWTFRDWGAWKWPALLFAFGLAVVVAAGVYGWARHTWGLDGSDAGTK